MRRAAWSLIALLALAGCACTAPVSDEELKRSLGSLIEHELADKGIPGMSIALVEGNRLVWAEGFGMADAAGGVPATAKTIYRIGSVSKLFTDIAAMQMVERGTIDLDAPVNDYYLPNFHPDNPFEKPITLRQLMSHRSGLVREPPVGHYFDASEPTLKQTVNSLNATRLVYEPESQTKYSNAGIAVVGRALEQISRKPFAKALESSVLDAMGLEDSAFEPKPALLEGLAKAVMWSYDGRSFEAPTFELGMSPAGSMYSNVLDLAKFMQVLFNDGIGVNGPVIQPESLEEMFTPQYAPPGATTGYGLGFRIGELDGHTGYGHGGAIYGFATSLMFSRDAQVGVVVVANMDVVNAVTERIAREALAMLLARADGRPSTPPPPTEPLPDGMARRLEGRYEGGGRLLELVERDGGLFAYYDSRYLRVRFREGTPFIDDRTSYGPELRLAQDGSINIDGTRFTPQPIEQPTEPPERFAGLIGEYGQDHNVLFVYERDGALHALIEWTEIDRLTEVSEDVFAFPAQGGMYHGEQLVFRRGSDGRAAEVVVAGIPFSRRAIQGEQAETFHIRPVRPVEELRREALAATPPEESGEFLPSDLVEVVALDPTVKLDIRYATTNNFMQAKFYSQPRAFMQRPAAEALIRAHQGLREQGYGLLIHDTYRPWYVTRMFWDATPEESKIFVADPASGSRHNRGCAADITLFDLETGRPVEMVGLYDEMTERSYPDYQGGTSLQRWRRELLRDAMEAEGFRVYEFEWWHFDHADWKRYRIENRVFEEIPSG